MKIICKRCAKKFYIEGNAGPPATRSRHSGRLCEKCWKEARCIPNKGQSKYASRIGQGRHRIDTNAQMIGYDGQAKQTILVRNEEIDRLRDVVRRVSRENARLKDELKVRKLWPIKLT